METKTLLVAGVVSMVAITAAVAHGGATGIVRERMDAMSAMSDAAKTLSFIMRGDVDYDPGTVRAAAEVIERHAGAAMTALFPQGSGGMPSEARPEIWVDWTTFSALAMQLEVLAGALKTAAGNGVEMLGGNGMGRGAVESPSMTDPQALAAMPADVVFKMIAQTCSACHAEFRLKKR